MVIELTRFAGTPYGVFGLLLHGPMMLYTLEPMWTGDGHEVSCIPADVYRMQLMETEEHGLAWVLMDVSHTERLIIRVGNRAQDTEGDILIGKSLGALGNEWALKDSAEALGLFHTYMTGETEATLNIIWLGSPENDGGDGGEPLPEEYVDASVPSDTVA